MERVNWINNIDLRSDYLLDWDDQVFFVINYLFIDLIRTFTVVKFKVG